MRYLGCDRRSYLYVFLTLGVWLTGCFLGLMFAIQSELTHLMRYAMFSGSSFLGLLTVMCVPFAVTYILCRFFNYWMLLPFVCIKGFLFELALAGVLMAFGSAGWLVKWILLFSDLMCVCLLMWIWVRYAINRNNVLPDCLVCIALSVVFGSLDYFCVIPIGESIFKV